MIRLSKILIDAVSFIAPRILSNESILHLAVGYFSYKIFAQQSTIVFMKLILCITCCLLSLNCYAQDPYLQESTVGSEYESKEIAKQYSGKLGMSLDQTTRFTNKIEEFVIRKQKIEQLDSSVREKLDLLQQLSDQETAEMANILIRPQLRKYRKLKKKIQPVQLVVGEVEE